MGQSFAGGGKLRRGYMQGLGGGNQIGLMRAEEFEHCTKQGRIAKPGAQFVGSQPGQAEQTLGPRPVAQHPAKRTEREGCGVWHGGFGFAKNCQSHR